MTSSRRHPLAVASEWTARILTVVLLMVGPAWLGEHFLGGKLATLGGLALGMVLGLTYLLYATGALSPSARRSGTNKSADSTGEASQVKPPKPSADDNPASNTSEREPGSGSSP